MLVKEQYIATCAKPLELILRERAVTDLDTLAKLAEQYPDAHGNKLTQQREGGATNQRSRVVNNGASPAITSKQEALHSNRKCYTCGKVGHVAKNCFRRPKTAAMSTGQFHSFGGNRGKPNPVNEQNTNVSIPAATNVVVCRAHGKPSCQECFVVSKSSETHTCNAM